MAIPRPLVSLPLPRITASELDSLRGSRYVRSVSMRCVHGEEITVHIEGIDGTEQELLLTQDQPAVPAEHVSSTDRARKLLQAYLNPKQQYQLRASNGFEVTGSGGGRYRISFARNFNVRCLDTEINYCLVLGGGNLPRPPIEDQMLAQLLLLQTDEEGFKRKANRQHDIHYRDRRSYNIGFDLSGPIREFGFQGSRTGRWSANGTLHHTVPDLPRGECTITSVRLQGERARSINLYWGSIGAACELNDTEMTATEQQSLLIRNVAETLARSMAAEIEHRLAQQLLRLLSGEV